MSDYKKIADHVIDVEIQGLEAIKGKFDDKFTRLVTEIIELKGRVIISGMGKSGHIANKICATLASTGTPAFFIHPGEASHGDLGMITPNDLVILLSNSGETKELADIIHYCKRFAIKLVGIVRRPTSVLVEAADIPIILPEIPEASEVNAPTTSTTMMLAFGDALAITLAESRGFGKEDFNVFHPGGKLGSNFIKVDKLMRKDLDLPVCNTDTLMSEAIITMSEKAMGCVAVIDQQGKLAGIITDGDLRRHMSNNLLDSPAQDNMTKNPLTIAAHALAIEAVNIMNQKNITTIFVVDDQQKPIGALHIHDCLKAGVI